MTFDVHAHVVVPEITREAGGGETWRPHVYRDDADAQVVEHPLLAGAIGRLAARAARGAAIDPAGVRPLYVRRPDAEIERDRKAFATKDSNDAKKGP